MIEYIALAILWISVVAGFIALFFTSIGTLIILLGCVCYAWMTDFAVMGFQALGILLIFYLAGEGVETVCTFWGAKSFGASNKAAFGAMVGGFVGAIAGVFILGIGVVAGTFAGIFLGAFLATRLERKNLKQSLKAGTGSVLGRAGAMIAKVVVAIAMIGVIIFYLA